MLMRTRGHRTLIALAAVATLWLAGCGAAETSDGGAATTEPAGDAPVQGAPAPGGGLTVSQARHSDLEGPVTVAGFLLDDGSHVRLCETSLESFPPQCGEPSLAVTGVAVADMDGAQREGDLAWVDQVSLTGEIRDATLHVADTAA